MSAKSKVEVLWDHVGGEKTGVVRQVDVRVQGN